MSLEADSNIFLTTFHLESHLPCQRCGLAPRSVLQLVALLLLPPDQMDRLLHPSLRRLRACLSGHKLLSVPELERAQGGEGPG